MKADRSTPPVDAPRHRFPLRRSLLLAVLAAIAVVGVLTLLDALAVARDLRAGRSVFASLTERGFSDEGRMTAEARRGAALFDRAASEAGSSPWLGVTSKVPWLGWPSRWVRAASRTASSLGKEAAASVARIEPMLARADDPGRRLALVDRVERELTRLHGLVRAVRIPRPGFLPPVSSADRELRGDLDRLRRALADGAAGARGLRSFLSGPTSYVVLAANNSEMRAGGMVLQVGVLRAEGGSIAAGGFRSTAEAQLPEAVRIPAEHESLYGWLDPGREWRNVGTSPNFPATAPVYAAMAAKGGLGRVDGALQIDVIGVRSLLEVIGPITLDSRRYDATNVERLMMHDLYVAYGFEQFERRHEFSRLAAEAFRTLTQGSSDLVELARAVQRAARGRHLIAWSSRAAEQRAWERLGIDGRLERDGFMATVQNHGGNKLDWFVRTSVSFSLEEPDGRFRRVRARIRIDNPTPRGEPQYVVGDGRIVPKGVHRAFVALYLPGWATNVQLVDREPLVVGTDGPMRVIATRLDIARFTSQIVEVVFSVPPGMDRLIVLPSSRAKPSALRFGDISSDDSTRRVLSFSRR